ncbi:MAG: molecular chaperone DnaK [Myxococcota bacterium]|jgi:molecular chaperone DnaK
MSHPCVGIDLGTTASALAVVVDGVPQLVSLDGSTLMPSVVLYGDPRLVGAPALNALALQPERGVTSSKRHLGTDMSWPVADPPLRPVDVATHILTAVLDAAERSLGWRPDRAVITVPAWFTAMQRSETREAGQAAGLTVERVVNEPTAAALAHAQGHDVQRTSLVYDLGGGTFDASVVRQDGQVIEVLASHGDARLGGDDIDAALIGHVLSEVRGEDPALAAAIEASAAARTRLRLAVEAAKVELSSSLSATVRVPFLLELDGEPRHLEHALDRDDLDHVADPLIERTLGSVHQVLGDAGLAPADLDELLLVGGATLQPLVADRLREALRIEGSHAIDPRRVVALGAALQGAIIDGATVHGVLLDVAPYSLSVGAIDHFEHRYSCSVITPRNTGLPSRHTRRFSALPGQSEVQVLVFQGGDPDPRNNALLARVDLDDLPDSGSELGPRPIAVTFVHDLDGLVRISVTDELTGREASVAVAADGAEQRELWEGEHDELVEAGLLGPHEPPIAPDAARAPVADVVLPAPSTDEALATFDAVLSAEGQLRADHAAEADALLELARRGVAAVATDAAAAVALYDELSDAMFDAGVYL